MQKKQLVILVVFILGFVTLTFSQRKNYAIRNGIGLGGGMTQFDIQTDNFQTKAGYGWIAGMAATVDLPHRWYTVSYELQISENSLEVSAHPISDILDSQPVEYKLMAVQASFLFHAKIIKNYFMIDGGPMIQYNGKMELKDESQENYFLNGYSNLMAKDVSDISKFNVNAAIGATVGFSRFNIRVQYIYGITNMLNKLNDQNLDSGPSNESFDGHQSMLTFMAYIYL